MSILSRLDAKFGRFAVPNLTVMLIIGQAFVLVAQMLNPGQGVNAFDRIRLDPAQVFAGEYWRVLTFVFDPPTRSLIGAFFLWYLFYLMGTTLEVTWGTFRYNVYLLIGYVATVACAFASYFLMGHIGGVGLGGAGFGDVGATNLFLYGTVFLAFARFFPDFTLYVMLVIPIRIRWLAMAQWCYYGYEFVIGPPMVKFMIAAAVANYLLFFSADIWRDLKQGHRRMKYQTRSLQSPPRIVHTCRTCGITSDDAPHMQFRYCSKCEGDCCYCPAHLSAHEHVVAQVTGADRKSSG